MAIADGDRGGGGRAVVGYVRSVGDVDETEAGMERNRQGTSTQ